MESEVSRYNDTTRSWNHPYSKTVYNYGQKTLHTVHLGFHSSFANVTMQLTGKTVQFVAKDITGLNIYTLTGRLLASVTQSAATSIMFNMTKTKNPNCSGTYLAELVCKNGSSFYSLIVNR
jgi:hypothetical protein